MTPPHPLTEFLQKQRRMLPSFFVLFLGVISAFAFPPYSFFPAWFLALALFFHLLSSSKAGHAAWYGFVFGLGQFGSGLYWIANSFYQQAVVPHWIAPIAVFALVIYLSLYPALAAWCFTWMPRKNFFSRTLVLASLFGLTEWLRGTLLTGFPWNVASLIWSSSPEVMQTASLVGSYGLSLINFFIAALLAGTINGKLNATQRIRALATVSAIGLLLYVGGTIRLSHAVVEFEPGTLLRIVQPNIPQNEKWDEQQLLKNLKLYLDLSHSEHDDPNQAIHILWPETAIPFDIANSQDTRKFIMNNLGSNTTLISGAPRLKLINSPEIYNSIFILGKDGMIQGIYDKAHLVPFGEFIPLRSVLSHLGFTKLVTGDLDFSEGVGPVTLHVLGLPPMSPLVCYEVIFSGEVVSQSERPQWLLNLTNDAWFGQSPGPYQHLALARFRAVEEGMPLLRAAGTGMSATIDPYGRSLKILALSSRGVIDTALPKALPSATIFSTLGNLPFLFIIFTNIIYNLYIIKLRKNFI